jgi:hypothetical protein
MLFHTDAEILNNVPLTPASIGEWVEWRSVLTNLSTGEHHRTVMCGGYYVGNRVESSTGYMYAMFENGKIGSMYQREMGLPVAFFRI